MKDTLGDRMKSSYEDRTRSYLPRRTFTIIRLDGKSFHTYTKNCQKPFDQALSDDLDNAIIQILPEIHGSVFAYTQSDEISILVTDFASTETNAWFDGNIQKIASVSSSMITAEFNKQRYIRQSRPVFDTSFGFISDGNKKVWERYDENVETAFKHFATANFDARVFSIPDRTEVMNYFIWRNQDCSRNSVSMLAQHHFSHKVLQGKSTVEMIEMLQSVQPWESIGDAWRYGRLIVKETYQLKCKSIELEGKVYDTSMPRTRWVSKPAWKFTEDKEKLLDMVPKYE